ncbi:MAG: hypothetical protein Q8903_08555 [Bacteroidota bacterium]|nr:hypothetical protein [Bacteroidota bacterium]
MSLRVKILSEDFTQKVSKIIAGFLSQKEYTTFINLLENEIRNNYFTFFSESNLLRLLNSAYSPVAFINECVKYPVYIFYLVKISINSNYLTDIIVSNPGSLYLLSNSSFLSSRLEEQEFQDLVSKTADLHKDFTAKVNSLRLIKKRELLRIALRDQNNASTLQETAAQLSILAKTILAELFNLCHKEILLKYNIKKTNAEYNVISLGKLGGKELNYSSDVDIIVCYETSSKTGKIDFEKILTETIYLFIESAATNTGHGFLYRIDLRLRPYGRSSSLCGNVNDYLNYYEARGEDWERQMLIKMDFLCGSSKLYEKFAGYLQPFIYPRALASSPLKQIAKMKSAIEKHNKNERDIKNSSGGIRDIEFSVQALQLLNGGYSKDLRCTNTLDSITLLENHKLLTSEEADILQSSYIFYRRIEHFLQLMNDTQTHTIPETGETLEKLTFFMGYPTISKFYKAVDDSRKSVKKIFNSITGQNKSNTYDEQIEKIKFIHPAKIIKDLEYLEKGIGLLGNKQFDTEMLNTFQTIKPHFIKYLTTSPRPDITVANFTRLIRNAKLPSIWYRGFSDTDYFKKILTVCTYSQLAIDLCAEDKDLRDFLFTKKVFEPAAQLVYQNISTKKILFVLAVQLSLKMIKPEKFCQLLYLCICKKIEKTILTFKDGVNSSNYTVAALGTLGNKEITFFSDLDLLFISSSDFYDKSQAFFAEVLKTLKNELYPFTIDCRLRPEGKNSPLAWADNDYIKYIKTRAVVWEFQSLCKISFVCGSKTIFTNIKEAAANRISNFDGSYLKEEISKMRLKMQRPGSGDNAELDLKHIKGGILDTDFSTQYLMLSENKYLTLAGYSHYNILRALSKDKKNANKFEILASNYLSLKYINLYFQNIYNKKCKLNTNDAHTAELLKKYLGIDSSSFYEEVNKMLSYNSELLNEITVTTK